MALKEVTTGARVARAPEKPGGKGAFVGDAVAEMAGAGNGKGIESGLGKARKTG